MAQLISMRWMLSEDGGVTYDREVTPFGKFAYSYDRDLKAGQIFFRHKLNSNLTFNGDDFRFFYLQERQPTRRCKELFIRREWRCAYVWKVYWTGTFSVGAGSFDLDTCEFVVKPEVEDRYSCLLRQRSGKVNVLDTPVVDVNAVIIPSDYEFTLCDTAGSATFNCTTVRGENQVPIENGGIVDEANGWQSVDVVGCSDGVQAVYWRERITTTCLSGNPVPPPGDGWGLLENNCATNGTATYVRTPTIPFPFGSVYSNVTSTDDPVPPSGDCPYWIYVGTKMCSIFEPITYDHVYFCANPEVSGVSYGTGRLLSDVLTKLVQAAGCNLSIASDFLEINPVGDAPGYVPGDNYVTEGPNYWNAIVVLQKSDAIDPTASNPATLGELTFSEAMTMLSSMRLFYDIDEQGRLRIEHWTYWTFPQGLDTSDYKTIARNAWKGLSGDVPKYERLKWMEVQGKDFVGVDIIYSGPCVNAENTEEVKEYNMGRFTTDLAFIAGDPEAISTDGFVLLSTVLSGSTYNVSLGIGALSGSLITNAPMSTANLEDSFWRYDRYLQNGNLNGVDVVFDGFIPSIEQNPVTIMDMCCDLLVFDPKQRVNTELGTTLGDVLGQIEKVAFEEQGMTTTLTIRYPY